MSIRRLRIALAILIGVVSTLFIAIPSTMLAQETDSSPLQVDIRVGYAGHYRTSQWFPVTVTASNDGPDLIGTLELRFPGQNNTGVFQREIELPRGSRKQVTFNAVSNDFTRTAELRLVVNNTALVQERIQLKPVELSQFMVGVLSSDPALLNSLLAMQLDWSSGTNVVHLTSEILHNSAVALSGIDALFIHDIDTNSFSNEQRATLELWVRLGGQLIIGSGTDMNQTTAGLSELLPVTVTDLQSDVPLTALGAFSRRHDPNDPPPSSTVAIATLKPGATALDQDSLLVASSLGAGRVIFSAFGLAALRAWGSEHFLWERVLQANPRVEPATLYRVQGSDPLQNGLDLPALQVLPFWVILLFILSYIIIVGPVNFLILRRFGRVELAWGTIPAIIVLFVFGTYLTGLVLRGTQPQVFQFTVAQGFENSQMGQATAFVGIFSPSRRLYTITLPPETLMSTSRFNSGNTNTAPVVWTDNQTEVRDALVDVSTMRTFAFEQPVNLTLDIESEVQINQRTIQAEIRNVGSETLQDALLVTTDSVTQIGTLEPGQERSVELQTNIGNFPHGINIASLDVFERQNILSNLFRFNQFGFNAAVGPNPNAQPPFREGLPDQNGVYLLAWGTKPILDLQINNNAAEQQSLVLYIIRLDSEM
ncbi:MAG: hypothetical protein MI924_27235 [Chloroflexales bacterium]|nr:hypothetical protein [Chloroflexales bacterium]